MTEKKKQKYDVAQIFLRLRCIEEAMLTGHFGRDIMDYLLERGFTNLNWRQVQTGISKIKAQWEEDKRETDKLKREAMRRNILAIEIDLKKRLEGLEKEPNWNDLLNAIKMRGTIEGNFLPENQEPATGDEVDDMSDEELDEVILESARRIKKRSE